MVWCFTFILFTKLIASSNSTGFFTGGSSSGLVISYPLGKNVLNPIIRLWCPLNNSFTLAMTPEVSILQTNSPKERDKKTNQAPNILLNQWHLTYQDSTFEPWNLSWLQETHHICPFCPERFPSLPLDRKGHRLLLAYSHCFHPSLGIAQNCSVKCNKTWNKKHTSFYREINIYHEPTLSHSINTECQYQKGKKRRKKHFVQIL